MAFQIVASFDQVQRSHMKVKRKKKQIPGLPGTTAHTAYEEKWMPSVRSVFQLVDEACQV